MIVTLIKFTTFVASAVSAYTTWLGFRSMGQFSNLWSTREVMPVLMALVSFLITTTLWFSLFAWYPQADKETKRKLHLATVIACVFIFWISTILSVVGLGGDTAMIYHMNQTIRAGEEILNTLTGKVAREVQIGTSVGMLSKQFANLATLEEEHGYLTSYEKRGKVVIQLTSISQTLGNLETTIASSLVSRNKTIEDAKEEIFRLRGIVNNVATPLPQKIQYFSSRLATINQLFQTIQGLQISQLSKEVSKQLGGLSVTSGPEDGTALGEAQKKALTQLNVSTESTQKLIARFVEDGVDNNLEIHPLTAIDMGNAVFRYAHVILTAWFVGVGTDYVPLLFTLILDWTAKRREEDKLKKMQREIQKDIEG